MFRLLLASFCMLISVQSFSQGVCVNGYYALTCRGGNTAQEIIDKSHGLDKDLRWHVYQLENILFVTKSPRKAGHNGVNLSAGHCSWTDRVINKNEPSKLIFHTFQGAAKYNSVEHVLIDQLNRCAHDSNCVYRICVKNNKNQYFKVNFKRIKFVSKQ